MPDKDVNRLPLSPDELDELDEIKKLIGVYDDNDGQPASDLHDVTQPENGQQVADRLDAMQPENGRQAADTHETTQPEIEQVSGPPAVRQKKDEREVSGPPAVRQRPGVPQTRPGTALSKPASRTPAVTSAPGTPAVSAKKTPQPQQQKQPQPQQQQPQQSQQQKQRRSALPPADSATGQTGKVRTYDVSSSGAITEHTQTDDEYTPDTGTDKFRINFDFDDAYKDVPENRPLRLRREKRTGCVGGILYGAFVICISILLAALLWMAAVDVLGFGEGDEPVNVTVKQGFVLDDITDLLYDAGLVKYKFLFDLYAGFSHADEKITAGSYVLNRNWDYRALVQGMTARTGKRVETTVTVPEGYTLSQIFTLLEDCNVCSADALWEAATNYNFKYFFLDEETLGDRLRLEGYLFPETYNFYIGSKPEQAIAIFLREFNRRYTETYIERAETMGYSINDIINIAAMIEREAGDDEERARIAAVIYNRLKSRDFPNLQIDATIVYALADTDLPFSTNYDHPYNTYLHPGLPPGPIANPGIKSIQAALYPDSTNEYYYALNKSGTHNFFRTYAQFQNFVRSSEYGGN